jgi:RHS repeat-associated protein
LGNAERAPGQIISLPQGGGALRGMGEKFAPDLQTGTGNFTVPIAVPAGRRGLEPKLDLAYSTGSGNGFFGLGWTVTIPGVSRKTSGGVPTYDDRQDVFLLSGSEDLVPVNPGSPTETRYRPRTEGLFARIVHHRGPARANYWEVTNKDGLLSRYGSRPPADPSGWRDPAVCADPDDPDDPRRIFAWKLTETRDPLGNVIVYEYASDEGEGDGHRWRHPMLRTISYADYTAAGGSLQFLATVTLEYEDRDDPFSSYTSGFEIRTSQRCRAITTAVHPGREQPVRRYELAYAPAPYSGISLLQSVRVVGFDDEGQPHRDLPPVELRYTRFEPEQRRFEPVSGPDPPALSLSRPDVELVDLTGDGLPDVLQLDGVARYWRNAGDGRFDRPRPMRNSPGGLRLADPGVQLLDADGDARADLLVTTPTFAGVVPLGFDASWDKLRRYRNPPSFSLENPEVRLIDLTGDGVTDAVRAGTRLDCFFHDSADGWFGPQAALALDEDGLPQLTLSDPRVHWADMTGDGLQDLVLVHGGAVEYWPNLGHGRWGRRVGMRASPRLPYGYDPRRLLLGDVDGDGLADLVYVGSDETTIWINRSGNGWSHPVTIRGCPGAGATESMRIADLLGTGTGGVLWSRDPPSSGRPAMFFLDLTGGTKPRLLNEVDNNLGARTGVRYAPSSRYAIADHARPATRWRTPLPFVVPVVAAVETIDAVSHAKLTTEYIYHHGYWDGVEREFRGFGCVEQLDTETFDDYHSAGLYPGTPFNAVGRQRFSEPTLTRTWFHLGPVDTDGDGDWAALDCRGQYWTGDPPLLDGDRTVGQFLRGVHAPSGAPDRAARRAALRALRGRVLRVELYARDASLDRHRPYTVTEYAYGLREEPSAGDPRHPRVFFPFEVAQRITQWERGDDPLTRFTFTGDYDPAGQPRQVTAVAIPRRSACRRPLTAAVVGTVQPDETRVLATHTRTQYATPPADVHIYDRVAQVRTYELTAPPTVDEQAPANVQAVLAHQARVAAAAAATFDRLRPADVQIFRHQVHHYDGNSFTGLECGKLDQHGLLTRTATLVFTEATLTTGYDTWRPAYLGVGGAIGVPAGAPVGFGTALGYRRDPPGPGYLPGWYADTVCQAYDVQLAASQARGSVLRMRDPLGHETHITPDDFWLFAAAVRDPADLTTTAEYNYRVGQPRFVTDPNHTTSHYRYHPLGLLGSMWLQGSASEGGTEARPEVSYGYELDAFATTGQPIWVRTLSRVWHASYNVSDDAIEAREYSDGYGRLVQRRAQADELAFGDDAGLLVPGPDGRPRALPGQAGGPATGDHDPERVVVSGWQVYDNKGRVAEKYEPFFDSGWDYQPEEEARRGRRVAMFYDPRGQLIRIVNPDGSQRRILFGTPHDRSDPDRVIHTPWVTTVYDENDLAAHSTAPDGGSLAGRAPANHHDTPTLTVIDALGRTVCQLVQSGEDPDVDGYLTRTGYDVRGNVLTTIDEHGRTAFATTYDLADGPLRTVSIDAGTKVSVWDAAGNLVHSVDERECVTLRTYDQLNRLTAVYARDHPDVDLSLREQLTYGDQAADQTQALADHRLGRLWRHLDEAGLLVAESYDFAGRLTQQIRQVVSDAAIANAEPAGWTANWATTPPESVLDPVEHRTSTRYDVLGRPVEILAPVGAPSQRRRVVPTYGRSGALQSIAVDDEQQQDDAVPYVRLLAYNARGQRLLLAYGNGLMTRYAYDPDTFRLTRLRTETATVAADVWSGSGPLLQDLTYRYDLVGNPTSIEERTPGCGVAGTANGRNRLVRTFRYDAFYRLTSATGRACADIGVLRPLEDVPRCGSYPAAPTQANAADVTTGYREAYRHDPAGNLVDLLYQVTTGSAPRPRWHRRFGIGDLAAGESTRAPNNRLTSVANGSATALTVGYDAAGNMTSQGGSRTYTWDHVGRLIGFQEGAGGGTSVAARYLYGADGARVKKWVRRGGSPARDESTVYLGGLAEHHQWTDGGGGSHTLLRVLDGTALIATVRDGPPRPREAGPEVLYQLADHLGSGTLTVDDAGGWVNREEYFPHGETSFGGYARKRYRFTGQERDEESGLSYHGARYYAPMHGRWTAPDPAGPADGWNLYAYARDNPLTGKDTGGLQTGAAAGPTELQPVDIPPVDVDNPMLPALPPGLRDAVKAAQPLQLWMTPEEAKQFQLESADFESRTAQAREAHRRQDLAENPPPLPPMEQVALNGLFLTGLLLVQPQLLGSEQGLNFLESLRPMPYTAAQEEVYGGALRQLENLWGSIVIDSVLGAVGAATSGARSARLVGSLRPPAGLTTEPGGIPAARTPSRLPFGGRAVLVDEDLSPTLATMLRRRGIPATAVPRGLKDEVIIAWAAQDNAIVLTNNAKDFVRQGVSVIEVRTGLAARTGRVEAVRQIINLGERARINPSFLAPGKATTIR